MTRPCGKHYDFAANQCENETFYCNGRLMSLPYSDFFDSLTPPANGRCLHNRQRAAWLRADDLCELNYNFAVKNKEQFD